MINKVLVIGLLTIVVIIFGCTTTTIEPQVQKETETIELEREIVSVENKTVKLQTSLGDIIIELNGQAAPNTVINFLNYVESGFYDGVIFHRVIPNFMIQGGGFTAQMDQKEANSPIKNEFKISNTRGTIAMAKSPGDPDSATCQFFINLVDNSSNLDSQNGGFTAFGKVVEGMDVVDKIASVKTTVRRSMQDVPIDPVVIESVIVIE